MPASTAARAAAAAATCAAAAALLSLLPLATAAAAAATAAAAAAALLMPPAPAGTAALPALPSVSASASSPSGADRGQGVRPGGRSGEASEACEAAEPARTSSLELPAPVKLLTPLRMLGASSSPGSLPALASAPELMPAPTDRMARLALLLVLLCADAPPAAEAARLLQLPAWLLGALPLSLLAADAGSTKPGTIASATLPRALLLGLNLTTSRLLPVIWGTSLSCTQTNKGEWEAHHRQRVRRPGHQGKSRLRGAGEGTTALVLTRRESIWVHHAPAAAVPSAAL